MDSIRETAICAAIWTLFGACAMGGAKAADWMMPDPPRKPIQLQLKEPAKAIELPVTKQKRPYVIG